MGILEKKFFEVISNGTKFIPPDRTCILDVKNHTFSHCICTLSEKKSNKDQQKTDEQFLNNPLHMQHQQPGKQEKDNNETQMVAISES